MADLAQANEAGPAAAASPEDIACPMCGYSLYGLVDPRCPECGYTFIWEEMRDASRRRHPFLFEHHPEANVRSFRKTALAALRPNAFWRQLHPAMPSSPIRLVLYWAIGAVAVALAFASLLVELVVRHVTAAPGAPTTNFIFDDPNLGALVEGSIVLLSWPWLTLLVLSIFQASMRKARVRSIHVRRCVVYCFGDAIWIAAGLVGMSVLRWSGFQVAGPTYAYSADATLVWCGTAIALALIAFGCWRLAVAYQRYLQFTHPVAVAISSQVIVALAWLAWMIDSSASGVGRVYFELLVSLVR